MGFDKKKKKKVSNQRFSCGLLASPGQPQTRPRGGQTQPVDIRNPRQHLEQRDSHGGRYTNTLKTLLKKNLSTGFHQI